MYLLMAGLVKTSDIKTAFTDVDFVVMLASVAVIESQSSGDERTAVIRLTRKHAKAIDTYAKKTVKVMITNTINIYSDKKYTSQLYSIIYSIAFKYHFPIRITLSAVII